MELNTMTIDHSYGMQNPELEWLEKKLRDTLSEITDEYMKDVIIFMGSDYYKFLQSNRTR